MSWKILPVNSEPTDAEDIYTVTYTRTSTLLLVDSIRVAVAPLAVATRLTAEGSSCNKYTVTSKSGETVSD